MRNEMRKFRKELNANKDGRRLIRRSANLRVRENSIHCIRDLTQIILFNNNNKKNNNDLLHRAFSV